MSSIEVYNHQQLEIDVGLLVDIAAHVLICQDYPERTWVCIDLIENQQMATQNMGAMDRSGPTDVLAFPLEELTPGTAPTLHPEDPPLALGDILLAPDYIQADCGFENRALDLEVGRRMTHGILHLMGYDHQDNAQSAQMYGRQAKIMEKFSVEVNAR